MNKLPEPFKTDWIKALRSGEYKQGEAMLFNKMHNSYCCLGVGAICLGLFITESGNGILVNGRDVGYDPIRNLAGETEIFWFMTYKANHFPR